MSDEPRPDVMSSASAMEADAIAMACGALVVALIRWMLKRRNQRPKQQQTSIRSVR